MRVGGLTDAHGGGEGMACRDQLGAGRCGVEEVLELLTQNGLKGGDQGAVVDGDLAVVFDAEADPDGI